MKEYCPLPRLSELEPHHYFHPYDSPFKGFLAVYKWRCKLFYSCYWFMKWRWQLIEKTRLIRRSFNIKKRCLSGCPLKALFTIDAFSGSRVIIPFKCKDLLSITYFSVHIIHWTWFAHFSKHKFDDNHVTYITVFELRPFWRSSKQIFFLVQNTFSINLFQTRNFYQLWKKIWKITFCFLKIKFSLLS